MAFRPAPWRWRGRLRNLRRWTTPLPTTCCVCSWQPPACDRSNLSLVAHRHEFLALGDQRLAFLQVGAVEPEDLVVGAGLQCVAVFLVGLVVLPDSHPLEPDQRRIGILRQADLDAAAIAIDAAVHPHLKAGVLVLQLGAEAAGIE